MSDKGFILVAEDDHAIATGLAMNLELEGYRTQIAKDGEVAGQILASEDPPDLMLLDIGMPRKDGLELLTEIRKGGNRTPVIVLSARLSESDKVAALRLGADDYVTKPFALAELMARVDAVLRRTSSLSDSGLRETANQKTLTHFGDIVVDHNAHTVTKSDSEVALTHLEFELLSFFMNNADQVLERKRLLREVWGTSGSRRTVDNFVGQLRAKLETDPEAPVHFVTVRGTGYRFVP